MDLRVLLLGSDTPLGMVLQDYLGRIGRHELVGLTRSACRWKGERQAKKAVRRAECELLLDLRLAATLDMPEEIPDADVEACHWLAKACQRSGMTYLLVSSDQIFSGTAERLYSEQDEPDGDSASALQLAQAEQRVAETCAAHLILRLGPVFSALEGNWLPTTLARLCEQQAMQPAAHLDGNPVAAHDAARVIAGVLDQLSAGASPWGIYHYCSADVGSAYELAETIIAAAGQFAPQLEAASLLAEIPDRGSRSSRAMDCRKLRDTFAIKQLGWRDSVADTVKHYFRKG
jgi:dTDP-4-dehydrorhamnose reductase